MLQEGPKKTDAEEDLPSEDGKFIIFMFLKQNSLFDLLTLNSPSESAQFKKPRRPQAKVQPSYTTDS